MKKETFKYIVEKGTPYVVGIPEKPENDYSENDYLDFMEKSSNPVKYPLSQLMPEWNLREDIDPTEFIIDENILSEGLMAYPILHNKSKEQKEETFTLEEIEDVKIIIKAKGKHFGLVPKEGEEEARLMRIGMAIAMLEGHFVVSKSLESLK